MADLLDVGIWQGCLSRALVGSVLVGPYEEMCRTKVRTRSITKKAGRQAAGETAAKLPPGLGEPLAGQRWAVRGVERFSLAGRQAWLKAVCLPVSSGTRGCRK